MYRSNLKHYPIGRSPVHLTYRLNGSLPASYARDERIRRDKKLAEVKQMALSLSPANAAQFLQAETFKINAQFELAIDKFLHHDSNGPYHLANPRIAKEIIDSYQYLHDRQQLYVYAVCVMSNHVHAVVRAPDGKEVVDSGVIMSRHKSHTSRICNRILGITDKEFWAKGYFDRTVRPGKFNRVMWYVLNNPVKAGLVENCWDWPHTWVNPAYAVLFGKVAA